jgi:predicted metalloprotease
MRWQDRRRSDNVTDSRGSGGSVGRAGFPGGRISFPRGGGTARRAGGGSIVLLIVVGLALWIFAGINPLVLIDILGGGSGGQVVSQAPRTPQEQAADDQRLQFVSVVLAETEDTWNKVFQQSGSRYEEPKLDVYSGAQNTACGLGAAATGPFYCPNDRTLYLDLSFFDQLDRKLGAPGDFAQAYVVAHEVGHHVQNLTGVLGKFAAARQRLGEADANALSVLVELQADCYAGVWAHSANAAGIVEAGDIDEALGAASAVGDDVLQKRSQGYVVPESFNHGTAAQRQTWFRRGFENGDPDACDTFNGQL